MKRRVLKRGEGERLAENVWRTFGPNVWGGRTFGDNHKVKLGKMAYGLWVSPRALAVGLLRKSNEWYVLDVKQRDPSFFESQN